jgi:hypothetical protein
MKRLVPVVFAFCLAAPPAWASGPFLTDDAGLTTAGTAQIETWFRAGPGGWEAWMLPAAQVLPNLEATLGVGTTGGPGALAEDFVLQGKTLFKPVTPDSWGVGLTAGANLSGAGRAAGGPPGSVYAYVPFSWSLWGDRVMLHQNMGYLFDPRGRTPHALTWNVAAEAVLIDDHWEAAAEVFGDTRDRPYYQAGLRWWLAPALTRLDLTGIGQFGGPVQVSLGVGFYGLVQRMVGQGPAVTGP